MKKRLFSTALIIVLILSGCGAGNKGSDRSSGNGSFSNANTAASASETETGGFIDYDSAAGMPAESAPEPVEISGSAMGSETSAGRTADEIDREMLVYSCSMSIDTLDFTSTINSFKVLLDQYGGFVEFENYDDGGSYGRWYSAESEKWQSYSATVRVPSRNYEAFCNSTGNLGDLRSRNASVQNLSSEYNDLSVSLEIYEAKEERYIALLAGITEDEYAIAVERELMDLQVQIATIKSRMNKINTDVSYSYVYITINEVKEYVSEPVKTDTFFDRLLNTLSDTGRGFVEFLETLLFSIIRLLPYLILIALLFLVILFLTRKRRARRRSLRQQRAAWTAAQASQASHTPSITQTPETAPASQTSQAATVSQSSQTPQATTVSQSSQTPQAATASQTSQTPQAAMVSQTSQTPQAATAPQSQQAAQASPASQTQQAAQASPVIVQNKNQ